MPRLAFASSTGLMVDEHFGRCGRYVIIDLHGAQWDNVETRLLPPSNASGHEAGAFERAAALLSDCDAVFAAKVGPYAAETLIHRGIRVFEAPYSVEAVLNKLIRDGILQSGGAAAGGGHRSEAPCACAPCTERNRS